MKHSVRNRMIGVFLLLLLVLFGVCIILNYNTVRTILSLTQVDDYPLYSMKYYGGYDLDYTIEDSRKNSTTAEASDVRNDFSVMCSSFLAVNEKGEPIFCRNLDYTLLNHPITVLYTDAPGKNASIAMADLFYLGYDKNNPPVNSLFKGQGLLTAPRITIDGMNEYGLAIAILSVPDAKPPFDPEKPTTDEVGINRIILDNAKTVDEAIAIFNQYNLIFTEGAIHFMIADANGDSAVIEFINGEIVIAGNEKIWQVCTNFIITKDLFEKVGLDRYEKADKKLSEKSGILSVEEAMDLLSDVSQGGTIWSVVYNLETGEADIVMGRNYNTVDTFQLKMKDR